jgi:hypothetical protein
MKKLIAAITFILFTVAGTAQIEFGIFAGPQMTSSKYTVRGEKQSNKYKYGFQAGASLKIPFDNQLYFSPAIFYSLKGYKVTLEQRAFPPDTNAVDNNTTWHTAELAFLLQYDFSKEANHFFIKLGPSLDFQLSGTEKFTLEDNSMVNQKIVFDFTRYGRYAANAIIQLGYEASSGFFVFGQYSHGLGSVNNADLGPRIRHRVINLSMGMYLRRKKIVIDTRNKE